MKSESRLRYRFRNGDGVVALGLATRVGVLPCAKGVRSGRRQSGGRSSVGVDRCDASYHTVDGRYGIPKVIWGSRGRSTLATGFDCRNVIMRSVGPVLASSLQSSAQVWNGDGRVNDDSSAAVNVFVVEVKRKVKYGQSLCIVGNSAGLGKWDAAKSMGKMQWNEGDVWMCEIALDRLVNGADGDRLEFKCVVIGSDGDVSRWEEGENHSLPLQDVRDSIRIQARVVWGDTCEISRVSKGEDGGGQPHEAEDGLILVGDIVGHGVLESQELERWSGKETVFMQQNEHPRERVGLWNTDGLQGVALSLVAGDREAGSWLGKLELAKSILSSKETDMRPDLEALTFSFIYLTWVANGSIECVDSGGHRRPNHHAKLSQIMFRSLEWVIGERPGTPDALVARRLQTRIPSFTDEFMQSTPLTRIRDIAHRGDIPQDLKREIKHTIQNKLHRNAGPEDLAASEALLKRVLAEEEKYSGGFVSELKTFLKELRDFFNAGSLTDSLDALRPSLDEDSTRILDSFILVKSKYDSMTVWDDNTVMDCMHSLTSIRALILSGLSAGLRNDAPDRALVMRQKWRLAEIRSEDYIFMVLSRYINSIEDKGGVQYLEEGNDRTWALPLGALVLSIRHIGLSGYKERECMAIENELMAWQEAGGMEHQDESRRLRATLHRVLRLTELFGTTLVDSLFDRAMMLGSALGVDSSKATVFAESEIRSNIAFQTSKLASILLKASSKAAAMPPWQVIQRGSCIGTLVELQELSPATIRAIPGDVGDIIAVVKQATGDEELVSLGNQLKGVILLHDIPHLSHLGVRARQEKLTFISSDDTSVHSMVSDLFNKRVSLHAASDGVNLSIENKEQDSFDLSKAKIQEVFRDDAQLIEPKLSKNICFLTLEDAVVATCGAKAKSCRDLVLLAKEWSDVAASKNSSNGSSNYSHLFNAIDGIVIPFGCLEMTIEKAGKLSEWQKKIEAVRSLTQNPEVTSPAKLNEICIEIENFINDLELSNTLLTMIASSFGKNSTLIVRSSANVEDLKGLSGAGLYDSVTNVSNSDIQALENSIKRVWTSLFSRRAVLARAAAGIDPEDGHMAVLIQPQLSPELSFVLHTRHPLTGDKGSILAEIAPGHGETLASGTRGSGWRLTVSENGVVCDSFANFSEVYMRHQQSDKVILQTMDYSGQDLSRSQEYREQLGNKLRVVGQLLEKVFDCPQDVEGCIVNNEIYIVQTRPQP